MRKIIAAIFLVVLAAWAGHTPTEASPGIGVGYYTQGPAGHLAISNAPGMPFIARDVEGVVVANGVVAGPNFTTPVVGAAPGPLTLQVGGYTGSIAPDVTDWWFM